MTAMSSSLVPLKQRVTACASLCLGRPASTHLLLAQACNNLIDSDAGELISAACIVYAELIQKDVSHFDLSFFPSSSWVSSLSGPSPVYGRCVQLQRHSLCYILCRQPRGLLCTDFSLLARITCASPSRSGFLRTQLIPHSLYPPGRCGHRAGHPGAQGNVVKQAE